MRQPVPTKNIYLLHIEAPKPLSNFPALDAAVRSVSACVLNKTTFLIYTEDFTGFDRVLSSAVDPDSGIYYLLTGIATPRREIKTVSASSVFNWLAEHATL